MSFSAVNFTLHSTADRQKVKLSSVGRLRNFNVPKCRPNFVLGKGQNSQGHQFTKTLQLFFCNSCCLDLKPIRFEKPTVTCLYIAKF